jgi:hypothetical protein
MAMICTAFMIISHYMKGGNGDSSGTAFFIGCLGIVDILLRINWIVLGFLSVSVKYYGSAGWCLAILIMSCVINLAVWRRFFRFKYNMDDNDRDFVTYRNKYPKTSQIIIYLSYIVTF